MILPIEWLKQFVKISDSPQKIAEILTNIGQEVEEINGQVLKLDITPNRGDCLSILGLAREYAAATGKKIVIPEVKIKKESSIKEIKLSFASKAICPRYTYRIIENIKIKPSPVWIQKKLKSYGFRPINNIVDITNFVMIELGQPMHAFDLKKISDQKMHIRLSKNKESLITLDGKNHNLEDNSIIIEDNKKIIDLAGIMGGYSSEVDKNTQTIILQAAIFDPILIRKASKKLKHITDASYRYERGVDWENTVLSLDRATQLILDSCPEAKIGKSKDIINQKSKSKLIPLNIKKINQFLSTNFSEKEILDVLQKLGFEKHQPKAGPPRAEKNLIKVPSWRYHDIYGWQDLVEEVGRIYGYKKLKKLKLPKTKALKTNQEYTTLEKIKDILVDIGYDEIIGYSFVSQKELKILGIPDQNVPKIIKPVSSENEFLRPNLIPSTVKVIAKNPWYPYIKIFEIGKVFSQSKEKYQLAILETGKNEKNLLKVIKKLEKTLNIKLKYQIQKPQSKILAFYKIKRPICIALLDMEKVPEKFNWYNINIPFQKVKYMPISEFHPTVRDLAFIVNKDIKADKIIGDIEKTKDTNTRIVFVEKFDEFEHEKFGKGKKNLAFHIVVDPKKKISEKKIGSIFNSIIATIEKKYKAKLRKF